MGWEMPVSKVSQQGAPKLTSEISSSECQSQVDLWISFFSMATKQNAAVSAVNFNRVHLSSNLKKIYRATSKYCDEPKVVDKLVRETSYKVVALKRDKDGITSIVDMKDGHVYYTGTSQNRNTCNRLMYATKTSAMRDASVGAFLKKLLHTNTDCTYERVVACFDGWGQAVRSIPIGSHAITYEFVRFRTVVSHIDKLSVNKNRPENSCDPHFFARCDRSGANVNADNSMTLNSSIRASQRIGISSRRQSPVRLKPSKKNNNTVSFRQTYETSPVKPANSEYLSILPAFQATCAVSYHAPVNRSGKFDRKLFN